MSLRLTNSLTNRTETFRSIVPNQVSIYCCGVTVYDLCHLGHARSYIAWDVLRRYLIYLGYKVTFVQNFTDIDDKILNRAKEEGLTMNEISERNINEFNKDMKCLGILAPDRMPRATKSLEGIRSLIKKLEEKGSAYSIEGDVYFSVMKHSNYGKLSGRNLEKQQLNADGRMSEDEKSKKLNYLDFSLWKKAKPGEPSFNSPWGEGRPGWHIECSAMVLEELGETIDIHLGGSDLIFPHHENEIAQSESATGKELAKYWLHNGMVNVRGKKMSKSLGNFQTIRSVLENGFSAMALRLFVLQANYRKPIDFTEVALKSAEKGWEGLNSALCFGINYSEIMKWPKYELSEIVNYQIMDLKQNDELNKLSKKFKDSMDNDLNTSGALSVLFELARPFRSISNQIKRQSFKENNSSEKEILYMRWKLLIKLSNVLGIKPEKVKNYLNSLKKYPDEIEIESYIKERNKAKLEKDFSKADKIRDKLRTNGIDLIDKPAGNTEWIRL